MKKGIRALTLLALGTACCAVGSTLQPSRRCASGYAYVRATSIRTLGREPVEYLSLPIGHWGPLAWDTVITDEKWLSQLDSAIEIVRTARELMLFPHTWSFTARRACVRVRADGRSDTIWFGSYRHPLVRLNGTFRGGGGTVVRQIEEVLPKQVDPRRTIDPVLYDKYSMSYTDLDTMPEAARSVLWAKAGYCEMIALYDSVVHGLGRWSPNSAKPMDTLIYGTHILVEILTWLDLRGHPNWRWQDSTAPPQYVGKDIDFGVSLMARPYRCRPWR